MTELADSIILVIEDFKTEDRLFNYSDPLTVKKIFEAHFDKTSVLWEDMSDDAKRKFAIAIFNKAQETDLKDFMRRIEGVDWNEC